jgi:hypothetical protein
LVKIELMCFSTAGRVNTSAPAMAELVWPWAIEASTSSSRGLSAASTTTHRRHILAISAQRAAERDNVAGFSGARVTPRAFAGTDCPCAPAAEI